MNSRRRITAALVVLLVLVAVAWLAQRMTSDPPRPAAPLGAGSASRVLVTHIMAEAKRL